MRKVKTKSLIALIISLSLLSACAKQPESITDNTPSQSDAEIPSKVQSQLSPAEIGARPVFYTSSGKYSVSGTTPCVKPYTIEPDLSNIDNLWQFYFSDEEKQILSKNGFMVQEGGGNEFFEVYETNRYQMYPSFITVDSMMHTYHLYFSYLLKNIERNYLCDSLNELSIKMLENSIFQYEQLKGSEWEDAAKRNVAFFTIGAKLLDDNRTVEDDVSDMVMHELELINAAKSIDNSVIIDRPEDYTQYKPRGYYAGDEKLERYFKAMMWYGRMHFSHEYPDMDRSSLLMTMSLSNDAEAYELWSSIYAVTAFFAGASDDLGACEYWPVICEIYGNDADISSLTANPSLFDDFYDKTSALPVPQINSLPIDDGEDNVISGFRFMGQRFTLDASVMQRLVYSSIKENSSGSRRMLPDVLDLPAALGSDTALTILEQNGATDYSGYTETIDKLRATIPASDSELWSASLYAGWLNTLRPLLEVKGEGYPVFMQNEEWAKKNLECFAGSYTELKHDTILYSKQVMAEMGGDIPTEPDYRGYVEPEPLVYSRFANLADLTAVGLKSYGMLDPADEENLSHLALIAEQLLTISEKELRNEVLTDEEYDFIIDYGGNLEHLWYETIKGETDAEYVIVEEYPAAIVVDIATDPNGTVLEAATGNPSTIYVVVEVDDIIKIARGSVYSFYQFEWPMNDRLTDEQWRLMMGLQAGEDGYYNYDSRIDKPEWTKSYNF